MKFNQWTLGLAAVGAVSLASAVRADEAKLSPLQTALSNTTISGYVDVAAQYNSGNQPGPAQYGYVTGVNGIPVNNKFIGSNGKVDNFSLNDVVISLDKPLDESPWASGYHIDLNAGQDALNTISANARATFGGTTISTSPTLVGVRQAYITLRTPVGNGIDWKIGAFDGITGYEGNTSYQNPNYTRSYGYAINPASEVGMLGTYKITSLVSFSGGIANRASNNGSSAGLSSHDYIASFSLTAPDSWGFLKGSSLNLQTIQGFDSGSQNNYSVNGTLNTPVTGLKVGFAYDKLQGLDISNEHVDGNVYGLYATYQATAKLGFNLRGEYIDGQNLGFFNPTGNAVNGANPNNGKGEEVTATVEYDLWANVVSRVEFRWDHTECGNQYPTAVGTPGTENAFMVALNLVYKF